MLTFQESDSLDELNAKIVFGDNEPENVHHRTLVEDEVMIDTDYQAAMEKDNNQPDTNNEPNDNDKEKTLEKNQEEEIDDDEEDFIVATQTKSK